MRSGAPRQFVRVCGFRRFQRSTDERALVIANVAEAIRLVEEIAQLAAKVDHGQGTGGGREVEDEEALQIKKGQLDKVNRDNRRLQVFFKEVTTQWNDIARRNIGFVDWAHLHHTRDIGTVQFDWQKFQDHEPNLLGTNSTPCSGLITLICPALRWDTIPDWRRIFASMVKSLSKYHTYRLIHRWKTKKTRPS